MIIYKEDEDDYIPVAGINVRRSLLNYISFVSEPCYEGQKTPRKIKIGIVKDVGYMKSEAFLYAYQDYVWQTNLILKHQLNIELTLVKVIDGTNIAAKWNMEPTIQLQYEGVQNSRVLTVIKPKNQRL
eukprot:TRINITY_DN5734_c0_g1_i1.p1 TRINITY_DN5734_c0_g1~~TRINITY_DN5734_c0_g1_i1.p1  ORF type:complete len:128 (+),score=11.39 TRINITY_DN5734_c0_g1_i1:281-664(+)